MASLSYSALLLATALVGLEARPYKDQQLSDRGIDSLGGGHLLRGIDSLGGGHLLRGIDSLGGGHLLRGIDSLGGGHLLRGIDSLGGGHLLREADSQGGRRHLSNVYTQRLIDYYSAGRSPAGTVRLFHNGPTQEWEDSHPEAYDREVRALDPLSGVSFGVEKRLDSLSGMTFGLEKRNFDEIDRSGFSGFAKRNFDEIDRSGFTGFAKRPQQSSVQKRNFDEIDRSGFSGFVKREAPAKEKL
ncbi:Orcokinin peptides type A [Amphibalanus amphitrite]|uniref:Orcokinin peptides type A n=1 Tax=Amphibalanus amphitrite TaxID=1232801 RepID=A0A6A4VGJ6_AMPAM|nr:Orcokinin peptides type A [Amphibalanus amphitrite]